MTCWRKNTIRKALRELTLSAVNNCTAINKEMDILFLILVLLLNYGYVCETALVFSTPA